jgi:pimeloyl-ACP methyl ester carboxylesterase
VELKTQDNWTIHGVYQEQKGAGKVVLLVHGRGRRKEEWYYLARALERGGFGYFAMDLRGHGDSSAAPDGQPASWRKFKVTKAENEYANMGLDVQAAVDWLKAHEVQEEAMVFVGDDLGGILALKYAAVHPKITQVAMISPAMQYQDVTSVNAVRAYKDRPILLVHSAEDKRTSREAPLLYEFAKHSAGEPNAWLVPVEKVPGVRLTSNGPTIKTIADWIANPVKPEAPPAVSTEAPAGMGPDGQPEQLPLPDTAEPRPQ